MEEDTKNIREVFWTEEFAEFYKGLPDKVRTKFDYVIGVVKTDSRKHIKRN